MDEKTEPLRILIVDDHAVVRKGLQAVLSEEGLEVIGEAASGDESVAKAVRLGLVADGGPEPADR